MVRHLVETAAARAEDIALAAGALLIASGLALKVGWWSALVALGVIALAYGVWITGKEAEPDGIHDQTNGDATP